MEGHLYNSKVQMNPIIHPTIYLYLHIISQWFLLYHSIYVKYPE